MNAPNIRQDITQIRETTPSAHIRYHRSERKKVNKNYRKAGGSNKMDEMERERGWQMQGCCECSIQGGGAVAGEAAPVRLDPPNMNRRRPTPASPWYAVFGFSCDPPPPPFSVTFMDSSGHVVRAPNSSPNSPPPPPSSPSSLSVTLSWLRLGARRARLTQPRTSFSVRRRSVY